MVNTQPRRRILPHLLLPSWFGSRKSATKHYHSGHNAGRTTSKSHFRTTFLTLCVALVLESVALQVSTTLSGHTSTTTAAQTHQLPALPAQTAAIGIASASPTPTPPSITPTPSSNTWPQFVPQSQTVLAAAPDQPLNTPTILFHWPLRAYQITQYYSTYHPALDLAAPSGTPIYATTEGVVGGTGYLIQGGGLMVQVTHPNGYVSYYAHLSAITSHTGETVNNATQIGLVGTTGWSTGPHLHFMLQQNGLGINSLPLLR